VKTAHEDLHSEQGALRGEQGALRGEHSGRSDNPVISASKVRASVTTDDGVTYRTAER
jgi:hypothetical protein